MWELKNRTPYAADRTIAVDHRGARSYVVAVKGTFDISVDGRVSLAHEQPAVEVAPKYRGEPGWSSLVYEQELVASKLRTDLYLNASAHSPGGRSTEVIVSLRTPAGIKSLKVLGDRWRERSALGQLRASSPLPFEIMPIVYERAYGGYDRNDPDPVKHRLFRRNPIGVGYNANGTHRVGQLLPNIEPTDGRTDTVGYGALCSYWEPRIQYQGTFDANWVATQRPLPPLDYDRMFLQCAPVDQQFSPHLLGGELIELTHLTPHGRLNFALPRHYFAFTTHVGAKRLEHRAKLSTVVVEPDHFRLSLLWTSTLDCHHDIDDIDYTTIVEKSYV